MAGRASHRGIFYHTAEGVEIFIITDILGPKMEDFQCPEMINL